MYAFVEVLLPWAANWETSMVDEIGFRRHGSVMNLPNMVATSVDGISGVVDPESHFRKPMSRALAHGAAITEVLVTDGVRRSDSEFVIYLRWPRDHPVYALVKTVMRTRPSLSKASDSPFFTFTINFFEFRWIGILPAVI